MKGCTFKRELPSGRVVWGYIIDVGRDENGKRIQMQKTRLRSPGGSRRRGKKLNEKDEGELVKPDPQTFAAFMQRVVQRAR